MAPTMPVIEWRGKCHVNETVMSRALISLIECLELHAK